MRHALSPTKPGPRQGARYTFQKHWITTGVASIAKGGRPRLHLFAAAPPSARSEPGSVHLRVGVTLTSHTCQREAPHQVSLGARSPRHRT